MVARPLDAEHKSNYNLTLEATDGTNTVSTQVRGTGVYAEGAAVRVCVCVGAVL